mmetsp:Transcript_117551/g.367548  ORF Transcript_117551/g.367548 Transcript_117551/m.367548 type:complete len:161 (+) Transcript_117551:254-736(+)
MAVLYTTSMRPPPRRSGQSTFAEALHHLSSTPAPLRARDTGAPATAAARPRLPAKPSTAAAGGSPSAALKPTEWICLSSPPRLVAGSGEHGAQRQGAASQQLQALAPGPAAGAHGGGPRQRQRHGQRAPQRQGLPQCQPAEQRYERRRRAEHGLHEACWR